LLRLGAPKSIFCGGRPCNTTKTDTRGSRRIRHLETMRRPNKEHHRLQHHPIGRIAR